MRIFGPEEKLLRQIEQDVTEIKHRDISGSRARVTLLSIDWGLVALVTMLIACMHYGYSCSCAGCDLVDSTTETGSR